MAHEGEADAPTPAANSTQASDDAGSVAVMVLDSGWGLPLYDPANPAAASNKLNPGGACSFQGPLHVQPAGDIGMGEFTNGRVP